MCHHHYADDKQIYITLSKSEPEMSLALLQVLLFGTKLHRKEFMRISSQNY